MKPEPPPKAVEKQALFLDPAKHAWLAGSALTALWEALDAAGGETRVVGGAVRDALSQKKPIDVDLATTLTPAAVMEALASAGMKTVPTGLAHGTVTAIVEGKPFEITTLRRDIETDGRRAKVAFTDDWAADAARRDLTINALSVDRTGHVYDSVGGLDDLKARRVRFIGQGAQRIDEDVLRLVRFFRFCAQLGPAFVADEASLAACAQKVSLLPLLSAERVGKEIKAFLSTPDPWRAWDLMASSGALAFLLPQAANLARLGQLLAFEKAEPACAEGRGVPLWLRRLVALLPEDEPENAGVRDVALETADRLRLAKRERQMLHDLLMLDARLKEPPDAFKIRQLLYDFSPVCLRAAAMECAAQRPAFPWQLVWTEADAWENPTFPLDGADFLGAGFSPGPRLGQAWREIESWWRTHDFRPDKAACLGELRQRGM